MTIEELTEAIDDKILALRKTFLLKDDDIELLLGAEEFSLAYEAMSNSTRYTIANYSPSGKFSSFKWGTLHGSYTVKLKYTPGIDIAFNDVPNSLKALSIFYTKKTNNYDKEPPKNSFLDGIKKLVEMS